MLSQSSFRIKVLRAILVLGALILVWKLALVQLVHGEEYQQKAQNQYINTSPIFSRGDIYFTNRDGSSLGAGAAILENGFVLAMDPKNMTNPEQAYEQISKVIPLDKKNFFAAAQKKDDPYEKLADRVSPEDAQKIRELDLLGVGLYPENWRFYPRESLAAHTLGFVGYKGDDLGGRYGLEQYYDDELSRQSDSFDINFFAEVFASGGLSKKALGNTDGQGIGDVYTTIEPSVQQFLQHTLEQTQKKWSAEEAGGIIINPKTGAIYAMAALPSYDPNRYPETDISLFSNPLTENVYEMGSIVKALTMAAGLDSGAVTADTTYMDKGTITVDKSKISNWDFRARGLTNMQQVLNQSLNLGAVFVMEQMGKDTFSKYMRSYGLGKKTGIDLPNEASGLIGNLDSPREIEHATASFGQGIAMTPMETVRALSSLANGGTLPNPHIVQKINYEYGAPWTYESSPEPRVLKPSTSEEITQMLVGVFDHETGKKGPLKNYSIATKTGTAEIPDPSGGYYEHRYLDTWFGYFPAYNPKFLVFLYLKHPIGAMYSSQTLVDPFKETTRFLLNYYEVPPDR